MSFEASSIGHERLNTLMISLGMEISDSILSALRHEVEVCRQEQKEQLAVVGPVLLGIDAVVRHIEEIRELTDARAFSLLNELVLAYRLITVEHQESQKAWSIAAKALDKVLTWQHSCIQKNLKKAPKTAAFAGALTRDVSPAREKSPAGDIQGLLDAVRQEIAATGMMAIRESAALLELVHVQKEGTDSVPADAGKISEETSKEPGKRENKEFSSEFNSVVRENISSLQKTLHQEMGRLRHEFIRE
ncbi:MAG: hypothetical protein D3903_05955 [Candidatus Electrothrix sp. GM3_4]|nr:hypothetical protein [Candidatus Electrothrix sp. GM3_4]